MGNYTINKYSRRGHIIIKSVRKTPLFKSGDVSTSSWPKSQLASFVSWKKPNNWTVSRSNFSPVQRYTESLVPGKHGLQYHNNTNPPRVPSRDILWTLRTINEPVMRHFLSWSWWYMLVPILVVHLKTNGYDQASPPTQVVPIHVVYTPVLWHFLWYEQPAPASPLIVSLVSRQNDSWYCTSRVVLYGLLQVHSIQVYQNGNALMSRYFFLHDTWRWCLQQPSNWCLSSSSYFSISPLATNMLASPLEKKNIWAREDNRLLATATTIVGTVYVLSCDCSFYDIIISLNSKSSNSIQGLETSLFKVESLNRNNHFHKH